jgi:hypothetical protein
MQYTLYRVNDDGTRTEVSKHDSAYEGIVEGARITEYVDFDNSYELHNGGAAVTSFRPNRVAYREWAIRTGRLAGEYIHSLDDRLDHDVDEVMSR